MSKERSSSYYESLKTDTRLREKLTKKELLDFMSMDIAEEFKIKTNSKSRQILAFKNNSYGFCEEKLLDRINLELSILDSGSYTTDKRNILENIRDQTLINPEEFFDCDQWIIVFQNGTFDIISENFYPIKISKMHEDGTKIKVDNLQGNYFYEIPHDYIEGSYDCRKFKKALVKWIDEKTKKGYRKGKRKLLINDMFEESGLTLSMNTLFKKNFLNLGPKNSGKTQLTNILGYIIGKQNYCSQSIQSLCDNKFAPRYLQFMIANIVSENPATTIRKKEKFKAITGDDDSINAEEKFGPSFKFKPYAKHWFNCNIAPYLKNDDPAFYERFIINRFPNSFDNAHKILNFARNHIINDPNEIQGIIHESIEGLRRLYKRQGFRKAILDDTIHFWKYSNNLIYQFTYDHCLRHYKYKSEVDTLFDAYKEITEDTKIAKRDFTIQLQKLGISKKQVRPTRKYYYKGIKLREED